MHSKTLATLITAVLFIPALVCQGGADNTITFDNQSGLLAWIFHACQALLPLGRLKRPGLARFGPLRMDAEEPEGSRTYFPVRFEHESHARDEVSLSCVVSRWYFRTAGQP